ncbi:eukaryotic translation initiation factor 5B isoform X1 [Drosophila albomicans]|uniref:Eukaryotic translation initiation factor 5B isoform X1 n=1 Tax=Drosophila albomicans TaxID=7291 RepID=A0A6P8Z2X5_DROAB|nr:eukaryotic translation initiation factor 5B isoform X1 [Drosophila albomicans]
MDLFDMVRAAPPPKNIRERSTAAKDTDEDSRGITSDEPLDTALDDDDSEDAAIRLAVDSVQLKIDDSENDETEKPDSDLLDAGADADADEVEMEVDNDGELLQPLPPKTKAQQKMFADVQPPTKRRRSRTEAATKSTPTVVSAGFSLKQCVVRIKRLTRDEIEAHRPMTTTPSPPKRGRPRKRRADETTTSQQQQKHSVSPPKKSKLSSSKVHIKLRPNGGDKHSELPKFTRAQTPPARTPSKSPSKVATTTKTRRRPNVPGFVSKKTIQRYGKRFFNCVVIVKRLKHSPNIQSNINAATSSGNKSNKRKSKSNLSVSFSEAVEIFGSSPRKSSSASSSRTVPTRLQRVDATGNVVEDIELPRLSASSATTTTTQCDSATKRSRATSGSSCNGRGKRSGKSKRSLRVPVSGLASLSIEDSQDANADDEYIVPNELPEHPTKSGVRRSGTPNPTVKRVTTTTTISDEDDDDDDDAVEPEPATNVKRAVASSRDARLAKRASDVKPPTEHPKPAAKRSRDKTSEPLAESTAKSLAVETDEEPEAGTAADASVKSETLDEENAVVAKESAEEEAAAIETAIDAVEQELEKLQKERDGEATKAVANTDEDKAADEVKTDDAKLTKDMKEDEEELLEQPLQLHSDEDDEAKPELPTVKSDDKSLDTNPQQDEDKLKTTTTTVKATTTTKSEAESKVNKPRDLLSPASLDVTTDDILEIQTSLEDERYLTLNSPCLSLTQRRDRDLRLESPDSNASFKSAQHIEINEDDVPTPLRVDPPDLADDLMSPSSSSVAATQQQQKEEEEEGEEEQGQEQEQEEDQEHNIFNGSEVVASGSSLGQETFSALDEMPNLDVDELGQLVEPDYQMSNSRNANSRDTPDDIMKLLES